MKARIALAALFVCTGSTPGVAAEAQASPLAQRSLLLDIVEHDARRVAVGERGHILLSADAGASWHQARTVPTDVLLTAVTFVDAGTLVAVGHDETILRSEDGGESWAQVHGSPDAQQPLLDVWMGAGSRGLAIGAYGGYFVTGDAGRSWTKRAFAPAPVPEDGLLPDYHLNRIIEADQRLYIAGEAGQLYRSDDLGESWSTLPSPYEGSFFGLLSVAPRTLLAFGLRGHVFRTEDGGDTWSRIETGTVATLDGGVLQGADTAVLVGHSGVVLVSRDGARSFTLQQQADRKALAAVVRDGERSVLAVGEGGLHRIDLP